MTKKSLVSLLFAGTILVFNPLYAAAQLRWEEETSRFPVYSRLLGRYKALKPDLEKSEITTQEKERLLGRLTEIRYQAQQNYNSGTASNSSEELKLRYQYLIEALNKAIEKINQLRPPSLPAPSRPIDPWDSVGFSNEVTEYRTAEEELRTHLCLEPTDGTNQERAEWRRQFDEKLLQMILGEEKLAFAASSSFSREDSARLAPIFRKQDEVRRLLTTAAGNDREAAELRRILDEYQAIIEGFSLDAASSKPGGLGLLIMMLGMRNVQHRLDQAEGISAQTKSRIIAPLAEITRIVVSVYADMRRRGFQEINRRFGAQQSPFRMHRPVGQAQQAELERRLLKFINSQMGVNLPIERGLGSFPANGSMAYTLFDETERRRFVRNECRDNSVASLRLAKGTTFSPADDVEVAYLIPMHLRGQVWVGLMRSNEPHRDIRYINSGTNITNFQPKTLESRPDGVFTYSAPALNGSYDVRMFDKETGKEVASVSFKVGPKPVEPVNGGGRIRVVSGIYGANCKPGGSNVTSFIKRECDGKGECRYVIDYRIIGDPAQYCAKDYVARWTCDGNPEIRTARVNAEAGYRSTIVLNCTSPAPKPAAASTGSKVVDFLWHWSGNKSLLNENDVFRCPPNKQFSSQVYGTDRYHVNSGVCLAALHSGVITLQNGGSFRVRLFPFDPSFAYTSTTRYGVTSDSYGWPSLSKGSFAIMRVN